MNIPLAKHYIDKDDIKSVITALKSDYLSQGPFTQKFESLFAKYVGTKHAVAVSSGTAGLHLAVKALGLKAADEVITTPFSFIASTNCLLYEGIIPIFVDIHKNTLNIDPSLIEASITKRTKAILSVDIFGTPANMHEINKIAKKYNLKVISDSCESLGSIYHGNKTGGLCDISVFSFFANKQMTTGEGGMVTTNSKKTSELLRSLRSQGRPINNSWLSHVRMGYNYRMTEIEAALGVSQLLKLEKMIDEKNRIYNLYKKYLSDCHDVEFLQEPNECRVSRFTVPVKIKNNKRFRVVSALEKHGIGYKIYFPPIYSFRYIKKHLKINSDNYPVCQKISKEILCLPLFIGLNSSQVHKICTIIKESL